jgi:hypothetical protein
MTDTNIAPSHPAGVGKSSKGGHHIAFMAQPAFAAEAKLNVIGTNMWRPGTPGHRFYEEVLMQNPVTVQECIDKAGALAEPFTAKQIQGHLRWMFTAAGAFLEVDGQRFASPPAPVQKPTAKAEKPVKPKKAKKEAAKEAA